MALQSKPANQAWARMSPGPRAPSRWLGSTCEGAAPSFSFPQHIHACMCESHTSTLRLAAAWCREPWCTVPGKQLLHDTLSVIQHLITHCSSLPDTLAALRAPRPRGRPRLQQPRDEVRGGGRDVRGHVKAPGQRLSKRVPARARRGALSPAPAWLRVRL